MNGAYSRQISHEQPLVVLQTSNRFNDSDEVYAGGTDRYEEAKRHGREAVRAWREAVPDDIKPYCELQMEIRTHDHENRYECFRRLLGEMEEAGVPVNLQFSDPHDEYVFDPDYVEKLSDEFTCIQDYTVTELRFEYYGTFNVPRYAIPPVTRHTMDVVRMAARRGKHVIISLQDMKWLHVGADLLNQPLMDVIYEHSDHVIAVNEHIGPRLIQRQASVWGMWLARAAGHWGVEPQSWWFENARMIEPGVFGQQAPDDTRVMPPDLYRAMILLGASMGATVYDFEPFWDLFDYDNSHCWRQVIYPTLMEVIRRKLIPTREQVMEKVKVAYQYEEVNDINTFHERILRDVDWIGDKGYLSRAAYGLWERYLEHELIPNKSRYYFIPLLPPKTPQPVLDQFPKVIRCNHCDSEEGYTRLLNQYYPEQPEQGNAWITTINGHTLVMQTHENLYERQTYAIQTPRPVTGLKAERMGTEVRLTWDADPGATQYHIYRFEGENVPPPNGFTRTIWKAWKGGGDPELFAVSAEEYDQRRKSVAFTPPDPPEAIGHAAHTSWTDATADPDTVYSYTVTATTSTMVRREGTVNYMDYLVFSLSESPAGEQVTVMPGGEVRYAEMHDPEDTRPANQVWHPIYEGANDGHRLYAEQIVGRIDAMKQTYDNRDWRGLADFYSADYQDANGYHKEYAVRAWKWWLFRNNAFTMLRQIRWWDFSGYDKTGLVRMKMFCLFRACRYDDQPFGYGYDGTVRIPRNLDEEVVFTWKREGDGRWRIVGTDPSVPDFGEMLWNSRGEDCRLKLLSSRDF